MKNSSERDYRVFGSWIEKGDDRIMIFNLSDALPLVSYKENKSGRKKETIICPEGWGDAFGEEFYDFSLENKLYYSYEKADWNSRAECKCIEEHPGVRIMSSLELRECAMKLRLQTEQCE